MDRVVLIAALKPGARKLALDRLQTSADGSEQQRVTQRQGILLYDRDTVFFFGSRDAGASVRSATRSLSLPLFEGPLHLAREAYLRNHGGDE